MAKTSFKVKVQKDYTADEFFALIKDHQLSAGQPEKIRYMMSDRIVFPPIDQANQVQIMKTGQKAWSVAVMEEAKLESELANAAVRGAVNGALSGVFGRLSWIVAAFIPNPNKKKATELAAATAKEIEALNL